MPGSKYADAVAAILHGHGCEVSIIDAVALASMAPGGGQREPGTGWDAADAVAEWRDMAALRKAAHGLAKPLRAGAAIRLMGLVQNGFGRPHNRSCERPGEARNDRNHLDCIGLRGDRRLPRSIWARLGEKVTLARCRRTNSYSPRVRRGFAGRSFRALRRPCRRRLKHQTEPAAVLPYLLERVQRQRPRDNRSSNRLA